MDTDTPRRREGRRVSLFAAASGVVVAFFVGMFVGLHPAWLPNLGSAHDDLGPVVGRPTSHPAEDRPPADLPTQPSHPGY